MARPERNNVDYFPFMCEDGKKMYYIEETYGNDGFATFVKLLRELAKTDYHYLDLSKHTTIMFLSAKCKVSQETLLAIINDLVEMGKFDATLWKENRVIWCQDFIDSIQDAYTKRNNNCITLPGLFHLLTSLGVRKPSKLQTKDPVNPQSIVEYSKEENNILFDFEKFWDAYGKKTGKQDCLKYFKRMSEKDRTAAFGGVSGYIKLTPDIKFRKDPIRYLTKRVWEDELPTIKKHETRELKIGDFYDYEQYLSHCKKTKAEPITREQFYAK